MAERAASRAHAAAAWATAALLTLPPAAAATGEAGPVSGPDRRALLASLRSVTDWQLANLGRRAPRSGDRGQRITDRSWMRAVFFTGVLAAYRVTGDPRYLEAALALGRRNHWRPGRRREHADDHCIAQVYVDLYLLSGDEEMLRPTRRLFDSLVGERRREPLWSWADALYMSPPAAAGLATATGDGRYLDWLVSSWRQTEALLYDRAQRLWYRDARSVPATDGAAGPFWARGNGWVLAGAARVLAHLPAGHPGRPRLERSMRELAGRLVELQGADGLWRSSLLVPAAYPGPEASASALIAFGLAAGVNGGVLPEEPNRSAALAAWRGLQGLVDPSGRLGHVQPVGREPGPARPEDSAEFAAGAMLLAAEQMLALLEAERGTAEAAPGRRPG